MKANDWFGTDQRRGGQSELQRLHGSTNAGGFWGETNEMIRLNPHTKYVRQPESRSRTKQGGFLFSFDL